MPRNRSEKQPHDCTNRRGPDDVCLGCVTLKGGTGRSVSNDELFAAYERLKAKAHKAKKQADVIGNKLMRACQLEMLQKANDWARERDAKK